MYRLGLWLLLVATGMLLSVIILLSSVDVWMSFSAQNRIYKDVEAAPLAISP
ncbi:hypothetical protein JCM19241_3329 [Vibrio ishigakensis]|uniref:Uncharacterized protein n=1 Tax=Vibrio ishigakensis TaxID=1481914 RepID=A0A0B8QEK4_9VIBR|nr:hypothetical protein JCM19241_3329 [Vibrio ishigakensis]